MLVQFHWCPHVIYATAFVLSTVWHKNRRGCCITYARTTIETVLLLLLSFSLFLIFSSTPDKIFGSTHNIYVLYFSVLRCSASPWHTLLPPLINSLMLLYTTRLQLPGRWWLYGSQTFAKNLTDCKKEKNPCLFFSLSTLFLFHPCARRLRPFSNFTAISGCRANYSPPALKSANKGGEKSQKIKKKQTRLNPLKSPGNNPPKRYITHPRRKCNYVTIYPYATISQRWRKSRPKKKRRGAKEENHARAF